jgi:DNA mismatch repair protein MutS
MIQQYLDIKQDYRNCLLFFRLGDFYELFFEDALRIAPLLDLTLTKRGQVQGIDIPMAGVPVVSLDSYLARLLKLGESVAICEQVGDNASGPMRREVVRVLTPGTVLEENLADTSPIVFAVHPDARDFAAVSVNFISGELLLLNAKNWAELTASAQQQQAQEILIPTTAVVAAEIKNEKIKRFSINSQLSCCRRYFPHYSFTKAEASALELLLQYLEYTQKQVLPHLRAPQRESEQGVLRLSARTLEHLEIDRSPHPNALTLFKLFDRCQTRMGSRLLKQWLCQPQRAAAAAQVRLQAVAEVYSQPLLLEKHKLLKDVKDLEKVLARFQLKRSRLQDLGILRDALLAAKAWAAVLQSLPAPLWPENLPLCPDLAATLEQALLPGLLLKEGETIAAEFDAELKALRQQSQHHDEFLIELERKERENSGLSHLKVGYHRSFGYFIELPKGQAKQAPAHFERLQTLKNVERFTTPPLQQHSQARLVSRELALAREKVLIEGLLEKILANMPDLQILQEAICTSDVIFTLAERAQSLNLQPPQLTQERGIRIEQGRHVLVEAALTAPFLPNDTMLSANKPVALITGPNMGGKSTWMRQTAIIVILAYAGSFVPAKQAIIGEVDQIFTRIGAGDHLAAGHSTFMVEMQETAEILHQASDKSLLLLDEIGRGTSSRDGLAIAQACLEFLLQQNPPPLTLFASHFFTLSGLAERFSTLANWHFSAKENGSDLVFLHELQPGAASESFGVAVAAKAGLPTAVLARAEALLQDSTTDETPTSAIADCAQVIAKEIKALDLSILSPKAAWQHLERWQKMLS